MGGKWQRNWMLSSFAYESEKTSNNQGRSISLRVVYWSVVMLYKWSCECDILTVIFLEENQFWAHCAWLLTVLASMSIINMWNKYTRKWNQRKKEKKIDLFISGIWLNCCAQHIRRKVNEKNISVFIHSISACTQKHMIMSSVSYFQKNIARNDN